MTDKMPDTDLTIPEFLRRNPQKESDMTHNTRTAEYTPTEEESQKIGAEIAAQTAAITEDPKTETTQMLEQAMALQSTPTLEDIMAAIRKLTAEIGEREKTRAALRAKARKMVGEI